MPCRYFGPFTMEDVRKLRHMVEKLGLEVSKRVSN
jgi:hypothetical protein